MDSLCETCSRRVEVTRSYSEDHLFSPTTIGHATANFCEVTPIETDYVNISECSHYMEKK